MCCRQFFKKLKKKKSILSLKICRNLRIILIRFQNEGLQSRSQSKMLGGKTKFWEGEIKQIWPLSPLVAFENFPWKGKWFCSRGEGNGLKVWDLLVSSYIIFTLYRNNELKSLLDDWRQQKIFYEVASQYHKIFCYNFSFLLVTLSWAF